MRFNIMSYMHYVSCIGFLKHKCTKMFPSAGIRTEGLVESVQPYKLFSTYLNTPQEIRQFLCLAHETSNNSGGCLYTRFDEIKDYEKCPL